MQCKSHQAWYVKAIFCFIPKCVELLKDIAFLYFCVLHTKTDAYVSFDFFQKTSNIIPNGNLYTEAIKEKGKMHCSVWEGDKNN